MVSTGVTYASAASTTGSGQVWADTDDILAAGGDSTKSYICNSSANSRYLDVTDFNFAIPSTHNIDGIEIHIRKTERDTDNNTGTTDNTIQLIYNGSIIGNNRAKEGVWPVSAFTDFNYGSAADTWGYLLTPDIVNDESFGVRIKINLAGGKNKCSNGWISTLDATIEYTEAGVVQPAEQDHESSTITLSNQIHEVEILSAEQDHGASIMSAGGNAFPHDGHMIHESTNPALFVFNGDGAPEIRTLIVKPE